MPIGVVARQARDFQSQYDAGVTQGDFTHEVLETIAVLGVCAGASLIPIDRMNVLDGPAERDSPIAQPILSPGTLRVLEDLARCGLTDIDKSLASQVLGGHLLMKVSKHGSPAIASAAPC